MTSKPTSAATSSSPPALPPVKLRNYDITERLGTGSYGNVYKARGKTGAREVVAVKCVLKSDLSKSEADNLITEISLLKKLKHPHIVDLVDFCWDSSYIYIVMEYCGGGDLSRFIKSRSSLPEDVCKRFLQELASALRFLRSKDIAHMDLKPSNILLTSGRSPVLKLADFGLSQRLSKDETKTSIRGSPLYMAPEMLLDRRYDAKVDLWSVGVILYECIFGRAPYKSENVDQLLEKIKEDKPIVIPRKVDLSNECHDLLTRCLKRDHSQRISFDDFFSHPFLDLEHMPSEESSTKAFSLVEKAVAQDKSGNLQEALDLYKEGLEYLVPIMQRETSQIRKDALRKKILGYVQRAEQIKTELNPQASSKTQEVKLEKRCSVEKSKFDELVSLSSTNPKLMNGLEIASAAEAYELENNYPTALAKYQSALGLLLPLLSEDPKGRRKTLLHGEVTKWMGRAEYIKQVLEIQEKVIRDNSSSLSGDYGRDKNCILQ